VQTPYRSLIGPLAIRAGLDPYLVEGVVWTESRGNADAFRHEPKFWFRYLSKLPEYKDANPRRVASSYGLMQIMYTTALTIGFVGEPEELFLPTTNIGLGCKQLRKLTDWANQYVDVPADDRLRAMLAAYNGGRGGNTPGTGLRPDNAQYAERVLAAANEMRSPTS
jgi:soluble lytic murein transglycosylase-like protein